MNIQFLKDGVSVKNWSVGGIHSPQFSDGDINGDGKKDLVIFDRVGNVILPFINQGDAGEIDYKYDPSFKDIFPYTKSWMKLRDFDGDGITDLFKCPAFAGIAGFEVHKGSRGANGRLKFTLIENLDEQFDILYFPIGSSTTQIYNSVVDIPEITDVDGDGDLDILAFEPSGSSVSFYKNYSMERYGNRNQLEFELETNCWGHFKESGFSEEISFAESCTGCGESGATHIEKRHAGSTVAAFDEDGNGLIDVLLGDLTYNGLVRLSNFGTVDDACMSDQDINFPSYDVPLNIEVFNSPFYLDVNNDGLKDLIVAPNNQNAQQNSHHIWLYLNRGTSTSPVFEFHTDEFLLNESLFLGTHANVAFTDFNQDGLEDIIVGTSGFFVTGMSEGIRLFQFQNIGTPELPRYFLSDDNWMGFSEYSNTSSNISPTFGDLDGDGDTDMLVGDEFGYLYYLENTAGPNQPYDFANPIYSYFDLRVGRHIKPYIADINQDGLGDIVIGERNFNSGNGILASLNYLQNVGTIGSPMFNEITSAENSAIWGEVYTKIPGFINNYSAPVVKKVDNDFLLITGSASGTLFAFSDIANNIYGKFDSLEIDFSEIREGGRVTPDIADIDNDGFFEMVIGNLRGGFSIYNTPFETGLIDNVEDEKLFAKVSLFPNPSSRFIEIRSTEDIALTKSEIIDINGKLVSEETLNNSRINIENLATGTYFLKLKNNEESKVFKFVKI